ncbi:MAG: DoxX family protein [Rhodopila sp.]|jgi:putative oxidoreductase
MPSLAKLSPVALTLLRIVPALLFMEHGLMKLVHFPAAQPGAPDPLPLILYLAALIEVIGGGLIALGLYTRIAAFICSGEMAFAYFMSHAPRSFWPGINGGDAAILFCLIFFYLTFAGPGVLSLDTRRARMTASRSAPVGGAVSGSP